MPLTWCVRTEKDGWGVGCFFFVIVEASHCSLPNEGRWLVGSAAQCAPKPPHATTTRTDFPLGTRGIDAHHKCGEKKTHPCEGAPPGRKVANRASSFCSSQEVDCTICDVPA